MQMQSTYWLEEALHRVYDYMLHKSALTYKEIIFSASSNQ